MDIDEIMPRKIGHDEFVLESIGTVLVSTIELPPMFTSTNPQSKYETGIIWDQTAPDDPGYHIDWIGFSLETALQVHESWCCPTKLAQLILRKVSARRN